jgi:hypothetical protein
MALPANVLKMRDLLLKAKVVDEYQMRSALSRLEQWGGRLPKVLSDMGMVDEENVADQIARLLKLPRQSLGTVLKDSQALSRLDVRFCEENAVFPVSFDARSHTMVVAMADPLEIGVMDLISSKVNARVQPVVSPESQIQAAIARHYRGGSPGSAGGGHGRRPTSELAHTAGVSSQPSGGALELQLDFAPPLPLRSDAEPPRPVGRRAPSANTLLDEMLGDEEQPRGFSEEELARIGSLRLTQQKTHAIVKVLQELLTDKGYYR